MRARCHSFGQKLGPKTKVTVLEIDDFALRRGDTYGTIVVNLETGKPLDLVPDRTADAMVPWLEGHQEIEIVSRDRASAYADAVKRALPQATQVADRYHLVQNLRDHLQRFLDRKRTSLPEVEDIPLKAVSPSVPHTGSSSQAQPETLSESVSAEEAQPPIVKQLPAQEAQHPSDGSPSPLAQEVELDRLTYAERKKKISRDKRYARYEQILALYHAGMSGRAIARELHMSRESQYFTRILRKENATSIRAEHTALLHAICALR